MAQTHTLVVGNGFDRSLGLHTSYADFLGSPDFKGLLGNNHLADHLAKKAKLKNWIDIELELAKYSKVTGALRDTQEVLENFKDVQAALASFIECIDLSHLDTSSAAWSLLERMPKDHSRVINFNYTNSVQKAWKLIHGSNLEHHFVHGTGPNIVFGVHDRASIHAPHVFLRKSTSDYLLARPGVSELMKCPSVKVFGHSLGETDESHLKPFFQHLLRKSGLGGGRVTVYYNSEAGKYRLFERIESMTHKGLTKVKNKCTFEMFPSTSI